VYPCFAIPCPMPRYRYVFRCAVPLLGFRTLTPCRYPYQSRYSVPWRRCRCRSGSCCSAPFTFGTRALHVRIRPLIPSSAPLRVGYSRVHPRSPSVRSASVRRLAARRRVLPSTLRPPVPPAAAMRSSRAVTDGPPPTDFRSPAVRARSFRPPSCSPTYSTQEYPHRGLPQRTAGESRRPRAGRSVRRLVARRRVLRSTLVRASSNGLPASPVRHFGLRLGAAVRTLPRRTSAGAGRPMGVEIERAAAIGRG
jgi:hypothetical protein